MDFSGLYNRRFILPVLSSFNFYDTDNAVQRHLSYTTTQGEKAFKKRKTQ